MSEWSNNGYFEKSLLLAQPYFYNSAYQLFLSPATGLKYRFNGYQSNALLTKAYITITIRLRYDDTTTHSTTKKVIKISVVTVLDRQNSVGFGRYYGKNRGFGFGFENCH